MNTYKNQLENFINKPKHKIKLLENFNKQSIWRKMIDCDYYSFSNFCNNYNFDKYEILNSYIQSYSLMLNYMRIFSYKSYFLYKVYMDGLTGVQINNLIIKLLFKN